MRTTRHSLGRRRGQLRAARSLAFVLLVALRPATVSPESLKLSQEGAVGSVSALRVSPDGRWATYGQDVFGDGGRELYSVSLGGGSPVRARLSSIAGTLIGTAISPDSSRVAFVETIVGETHLYSVPIAGPASEVVQLTGPMADEYPDFIEIGPDSSRVVFAVIGLDSSVLWSAPLDGSTAAVPLHEGVAGHYVDREFVFSPDSSRVVFTIGHSDSSPQASFVCTLYSAPADGTFPPVILAGPLEDCSSTPLYRVSPDSTRVLLVESDGLGFSSIPLDGPAGDAVPLGVPAGTTSGVYGAEIAPGSQRVVFRADLGLYSVPLDGGSPPVSLGSSTGGFEIDPSSQWVIHRTDPGSGKTELFRVPIGGPAAASVKLNGPITPAEGDVLDFKISPDGQWVVYRADQIVDGWPTGFRAPLAGSEAGAELIWGLAPTSPFAWDVSADSRSVVLASNYPFVDSVVRPWRVPLVGTPQTFGRELVDEDDFQPDGDVDSLVVGAAGRVLYTADQDEEGHVELYLISDLFADGFESGDTSAWQ